GDSASHENVVVKKYLVHFVKESMIQAMVPLDSHHVDNLLKNGL
ncbi:MAG: hypothetical protein ACJA0W_004213, partial [Candidatus Azotimanducaceae bacterium]